MSKVILLDAGPLGRIAHPKPNKDLTEWMRKELVSGTIFMFSEVTDFEVRRSFVLHNLTDSIQRLDELGNTVHYLPITTEVMRKAADLWAMARKTGKPTADNRELDCDVILAAQAIISDSIIVTENVGHLSRFVEAFNWKDIIAENKATDPSQADGTDLIS